MPHENFIQAHRRNTARHKTASSFRGFQRRSIILITKIGRERRGTDSRFTSFASFNIGTSEKKLVVLLKLIRKSETVWNRRFYVSSRCYISSIRLKCCGKLPQLRTAFHNYRAYYGNGVNSFLMFPM